MVHNPRFSKHALTQVYHLNFISTNPLNLIKLGLRKKKQKTGSTSD